MQNSILSKYSGLRARLLQSYQSPLVMALHGVIFIALLGVLTAYDGGYFMVDELRWSCMLVAATGVAWLAVFTGSKNHTLHMSRLDIVLGLIVLYVISSCFWSAYPQSSLLVAYFVGASLCLLVYVRRYLSVEAYGGLLALSWLINLAHYMAYPERWGGFHNENFYTEYLLVVLPYLAFSAWYYAHRFLKTLFTLMAIMSVGLLVYIPSKIEFLALFVLACTVLPILLYRRYPRLTVVVLLLVTVLLGIGVFYFWSSDNGFKTSIMPRLGLVMDALHLWAQQPWFGHGAGTFPALYPSVQEFHLHWLPAGSLNLQKYEMARAVHNDYVQGLSDFGVVGMVLFITAIGAYVRALPRLLTQSDTQAPAVSILLLLSIACIEFPFQNPATLLIFILSFALVSRSFSSVLVWRPTMRWGLLFVFVLATVWSVLNAYIITRVDTAQRAFKQATQLYFVDPANAFILNQRAQTTNPFDFRIRVQLYESLVHWHRSVGIMPVSVQEYLAIYQVSRAAGPQMITELRRLEFLLDTGEFQTHREETQEKLAWLVIHAPNNPDVWIAQAYWELLSGSQMGAQLAIAKASQLSLNETQVARVEQLKSLLQSNNSLEQ